ncbi:MAG: aminoacyl-tRNA deacylase [Anaerolineae bacterium]|nr:aminoacyl-tRNA deacylase [Anaerolineae bacterium]
MPRIEKTLAMRVLEGQCVPYEVIVFPDTIHDAHEVAEYADLPPENVYKTLVVQADDVGFKPMLILVAADRALDLKKTAQAVGAKKVHMSRHTDAERLTGLKVGGISALALLNKGFTVYLDEWATLLDFIVVSAGQRGLNLKLGVDDLIRVTGAQVIEVSM